MPTGQTHTVQRQETLIGIADRYRLPSWKAIWEAPDNAELRRKRQKPNLILPGDRLYIPPDPLSVAQARLTALERLRREISQHFAEQDRELDASFRRVKQTSDTIDAVATVATILVNLGSLVRSGHQAMSKTGEELARANAELVKTHVVNKADTVGGIVGGSLQITGEEGLAWGIGKVALKSWSELTSPSYWAGRWVGQTNESAYTEARQQLDGAKRAALEHLDRKIADTRRIISDLSSEKHAPMR